MIPQDTPAPTTERGRAAVLPESAMTALDEMFGYYTPAKRTETVDLRYDVMA